VNQVQVQVVGAETLQGLRQRIEQRLVVQVRREDLGGEKEIVAITVVDDLADGGLVPVALCGVDVRVAAVESDGEDLPHVLVGQIPGAEANEGQCVAGRKRPGRKGRHKGGAL
jgi:hypothetical protein